MSEPKRATFSTISTQNSEVKKVKTASKTVRLCITLPESNEQSCPEYNYRDLLRAAEQKKNKIKEKPSHGPPNGLCLDPSDDNDDDVKRIAKQFEEKYGNCKKKRRGKKDDYADIGAGYDESDSFIDNTDAYDEMVPENVTTVHGGFYINSGPLEFKQVEVSASDSSDSEAHNKSKNRKRVIEDSDDSDSDENEKPESKPEHQEKKPKVDTNNVHKPAKKRIILTDDKEQLPKKKKLEVDKDPTKKKSITVKDLLRERREDLDMTIEIDAEKTPAKLSISTTINDVIESVVNAGRVENVDETSKDSLSSSGDVAALISDLSSNSDSSRDGPTTNIVEQPIEIAKSEPEQPAVKLPDNLPTNILELISNIKKAAENSEGKVKFFSGSVNNMLLNLEVQCRKLARSVRLQVYEYLAPFVKCKKDTLMRRAKNLLLEEERSKLKEPLKKLKAAVAFVMPLAIKTYEKECQRVKEETMNANDNDKMKKSPRKKFPWSEDIRKVLSEIISIKKKCFMLEGIRKETFEEHLETFLKSFVIYLWPEGWMTITSLVKQCKYLMDGTPKPPAPVQPPIQSKPMSPISLDVHVNNITSSTPYTISPVKNMSPNSSIVTSASGVTVIPIQTSKSSSPLPAVAGSVTLPKVKHLPTIKSSDSSVSVSKKPESAQTVINMSAEISAVPPKENPVPPVFPLSNKHSVTITSVDLRTNIKKDSVKDEECVSSSQNDFAKVAPIPIQKPTSLKQRILNEVEKPQLNDNDCQIIDLTETPTLIRRPGPKSKTKYVESTTYNIKAKSVNQLTDPHRTMKVDDVRKPEEITGTQALNQIITGLTKINSNANDMKPNYKENQLGGVEADMEQVMKDLKELQQMQEHSRKTDMDIMAPSSSPVSVIAYNSNYSTKVPANEVPAKERKAAEPHGFQDVFQKHLYQELPLLKQSQPSSIYNTNVQPKNNYNSLDNFSYSRTGSVPSSVNNLRFTQTSNKYNTQMNHLQPNLPGSKQKSPP